MYRNFEKGRYRFTFLLPELLEHEALVKDLEPLGANFIIIPKNYKPQHFALKLVSILRSGEVDIIHSHGFSAMAYAAPLARIFRVKHLATSHDILQKEQFSGAIGTLKKSYLGMALRMADIIHLVSGDQKGNLLQFFPDLSRARVEVIPNGIETERFIGDNRRDFRRELGLSPHTFLVGFFGRFMSQKGFKYLVQAIELIRDSGPPHKEPVVLSFAKGGFIREEMRSIRLKKMERNFKFLQFADNISDALRGVDVVAIPSLWEACSLLPMEALSAGVPVIGTSCIGLGCTLKDTPAQTVPPADSRALASALIREMKRPSLPEARAFRAEAVSRFDVKKGAHELERLIFELGDRSPG